MSGPRDLSATEPKELMMEIPGREPWSSRMGPTEPARAALPIPL